jgi:hypothetical protein
MYTCIHYKACIKLLPTSLEIFMVLRAMTSDYCSPREVKDKTIPLQALADPECSRRLRLPDFKTIGT